MYNNDSACDSHNLSKIYHGLAVASVISAAQSLSMDAPRTAQLVAQILNAAYMVRHYARGGRSTIGQLHRAQAIQHMGLAVREAFSQSEDFEPLLAAVATGLSPRDDPPF